MKPSPKQITQTGLFAALIAVCAQIAIPMPGGVPMTLQVWAILLTALVLGAKSGGLAALIYVLMGSVGVPVFAQFTGGMGIVLGPTGGFILSFPLMAIIVGAGAKKGGRVSLAVALFAALSVNFAAGMLHFAFVMQSTVTTAFLASVAPFLPIAGLQMLVFVIWGPNIKTLLARAVRT